MIGNVFNFLNYILEMVDNLEIIFVFYFRIDVLEFVLGLFLVFFGVFLCNFFVSYFFKGVSVEFVEYFLSFYIVIFVCVEVFGCLYVVL